MPGDTGGYSVVVLAYREKFDIPCPGQGSSFHEPSMASIVNNLQVMVDVVSRRNKFHNFFREAIMAVIIRDLPMLSLKTVNILKDAV